MTTQPGKRLHRAILDILANAPLSFFTTTDFSAVTNVFSQVMTRINGEFSLSLLNTAIQAFDIFIMTVVVAVGTPWLAIAYPLVFVVIYVLQMIYLRTSRQLRLLDLEAKNPLHQDLLDLSQRRSYLMTMTRRLLASLLNLINMVHALGVAIMVIRGISGLNKVI
ncbi:hypothetical protein DER46DRAFT_578508 [Fusarium sp. MPI-SDFR-AT-0072]|nr:hypothetical protein DER46DRAFT_578508 [Fusarium sp. MPI-SDFR-AT-0072]